MWTDVAVFCVVAALAVATVAGAAAVRRTTLTSVRIAGSTNFFADPDVQQELRTHGWNVAATGFGSEQVAQDVPLSNYDIAFVASQLAAQPVQEKLNAQGIQNTAYVPFQSRMVVVSYRPIAALLEKIGVARLRPDGSWTFNVAAYLNVVQRGIHWQDIPGNRTGSKYPGTGRVLLSTTDPRYSNSADMFIAIASYVLNHDNVVMDQATVSRELPQIAQCFTRQGAMPTGTNPLFNSYLRDGVPLAFVYENDFVGQELADKHRPDKLISPDMVLMYPNPDIDVQNTFIPISKAGQQVSQLFFSDPRLQWLAEQKYGYMNTKPGRFAQDMAAQHIAVARQLTEVAAAPTETILESFLNGIP